MLIRNYECSFQVLYNHLQVRKEKEIINCEVLIFVSESDSKTEQIKLVL